jgi:hypothetical protein
METSDKGIRNNSRAFGMDIWGILFNEGVSHDYRPNSTCTFGIYLRISMGQSPDASSLVGRDIAVFGSDAVARRDDERGTMGESMIRHFLSCFRSDPAQAIDDCWFAILLALGVLLVISLFAIDWRV